MTGKRTKKRSEKLSDSFVARLSREIGPSDRLSVIAGDARANAAGRERDRLHAASLVAVPRHGFTRCPHCREYVPLRDVCRACNGPM